MHVDHDDDDDDCISIDLLLSNTGILSSVNNEKLLQKLTIVSTWVGWYCQRAVYALYHNNQHHLIFAFRDLVKLIHDEGCWFCV